MQRTKKKKRPVRSADSKPAWQVALWSLCLAWAVTILGLLLATTLFYTGLLSTGTGAIQACAYVIMVLSLIIGGGYFLKQVKGRECIWILSVLFGYLIVRFLFAAILTFL